jgi:antitoxin component YwqK of YwqJK toxin-antitoxin module
MSKNKYNTEGKKEGYWEEYHENGELWYKGSYTNGIMDGYWEFYYSDGGLMNKGNFRKGKKVGYWEYITSINIDFKEYYLVD